MEKISADQKYLLKMFERGLPVPRIGINRIWKFLSEKDENEPLDPRWKDIWDKYRRYAHRILPQHIIAEIDEQIQNIDLFAIDDEIWKVRTDSTTKITFLLGAGASAPSGIPTVDKLLPELWKRAKKIGPEDLDKLAKWCDERNINNIEDLLTAAYISNFAAKNSSVITLLDYFIFSGRLELTEIDVSSISLLQDTLQTLFGLLTSTMISASPNHTHRAIVDFIKEHKNTSIITTNYDGCMDEALLRKKIPFKGTLSRDNENNPDAVQLIKMHGSINWAYCDSCQDVKEFDLNKIKKIYKEDVLSYPVIGICKNCGGSRRPLLVPPLSFKLLMFPNLIDIWNSARQVIEEADYLIVVGYSFSDADTYITKIISRSMSMNNKQKMIVVNTNSDLVPTLRKRFLAYIDKFNDKRILQACVSCEEVLPKILNSMLGKDEHKKKAKNNSKK